MDPWSESDAVSLRKFIHEHPAFMQELKRRMPKIETTNTEATAMSGAKHAGAEEIIDAIEELTTRDREPRATPFIDPTTE